MFEKEKPVVNSKNKLRFILRKLMIETRIRESELSRALGINRSTLHQLLNMEEISPKVETLRPIAKYFNVSLDQLIGDSPLKKIDNSSEDVEEDNTDLREWNLNLYKRCVDEVCATVNREGKTTGAIKTLNIIKEVYFYSLGKGGNEVDMQFAKWLINNKK